ncbi:hypothetical protein PRIPAC_74086 [Pristionchus pacificus]|uniref:Sterile alpha motif containing protein n=1 Tax=Pristionchus pacificus TaxID=54126 RepID=A0A2A6CQW8_PRIPA|nr:hypothetical protein PRIPAC_74086 [Pristionchus pacificus]|eukprot:PDM80612.1 Sterile alpha motif containing protein [Pristionchus pacificus]
MESEWARFFTLAGIPDGIASKYAKSFSANRVTREMVADLDKETLVELGITAVGDQLAVMRRVKAVAAMEKAGSGSPKKATVTAPTRSIRAPIAAPSMDERFTTLDDRCASVQRRGKPPPDRHEIYHVKMPAGTTAKSRQILKKVEALKRSGLHPRGTSGVRKAGMAVLSVAEQRERDMEVTSTTGGRVGGMHVDRLGGVRGGTGRIVKRVIGGSGVSSGGLFGAAMAVAGTGPVVMRKKLRVERIDGGQGRLPSVKVQLGNRVRMVGNGGGGGGHIQKQVVVGGGTRRGLAGRVNGGGQRGRVMVEYEDEEEEMEEEEMYEDEEGGVEYDDEEEIEYEEEMEDEDSTLVVGPSSLGSRVQTRFVPARQNRPQIVHANTRRAPVVQRNSSIFDRIQFNR